MFSMLMLQVRVGDSAGAVRVLRAVHVLQLRARGMVQAAL
jgi:hypothetical protein